MAFSVTCGACGWELLIEGSEPALDACPQCGASPLDVRSDFGESFATGEDVREEPARRPIEPVECVGREDELHTLTRWMLVDRKRRIALYGPSGIGKSVLARRFSERYATTSGGEALVLSDAGPIAREIRELNASPRDLVLADDIGDIDEVLDAFEDVAPEQPRLVVGRKRPSSTAVDAVLELEGLPSASIAAMLRRAGLREVLIGSVVDRIKTQFYGHPLVVATIAELIARPTRIEQVFEDLQPFERPGTYPVGHSDKAALVAVVSDHSELLFELVRDQPHLLHELSARQFEQLVAEMLSRNGFEVSLTPIARDGGKDIYAAKKDQLGAFLYVVECKRYAPNRPVGVSLVRSLYGVVRAENATAGILVTTSRFTQPARDFQHDLRYQLSLRDYHDVAHWLRTTFS